MKITPSATHLLVLSPLYPPHIGGLESHAAQFNREMSARGHQVTVFTPLVTPNTKITETEGEVKIYRFPAFQIIPNYPVPKLWHPLFWRQLNQSLKSSREFQVQNSKLQTIVISRTRFFLTSLIALAVSKIYRIPWLHIEHGSDYVHLNNPFTSFLARFYDHTFGRLVFYSADALVANSKASAAFVKKFVPHRQVTVIYRGVDTEAINKISPIDIHKTYNLPPETRIITFCGRLIDGKGVHILLKAISKNKDLPIHCFIIGDGPQAANLKKQTVELTLNDIVTFTGALPWEASIAMLKATDVVVNPSFNEGIPTSIIEAAICDKAIIATDVGGTKEITPPNSIILIPFNNSDILATKIHTLVIHHERISEIGKQSTRNTKTRFNWQTSIDLYQSIISRMVI